MNIRTISSYNKNSGFTMVEILVVLVIIAILSSMVTWYASNSVKRAKETHLMVMVRNLTDDVFAYINDYDLKHRWRANNNVNYLNGKLETVWGNAPFDNVFDHKNPYSFSKAILNWRNVPNSLKNPAIFITNNLRFSYDGTIPPKAMEKLKGTVVVWMRNNVSKVEIFYIDMDGNKSRLKNAAE